MIYYMKCQKCYEEFPESEIQVSHDVPKYIGGTDLDGRHNLCKKHHKEYDFHLLKKFLKFLGEELIEGEESQWMFEIKRLDERLKEKLRDIAKKECEVYFK